MIIIAHRGNINGPSKLENHPDYILDALSNNFNVEIDLWFINNKYVLGHDGPQYEIDKGFLFNTNLWIHCKNISALHQLTKESAFFDYGVNYFFHDVDACTLTSGWYIWTYPGHELTPQSIAVMPERIPLPYDVSIAAGICTDYPKDFKNNFNFRPQ